ncbi:MAG: STAS domain-containing protein [Candidatus Adiutrix sp.]|jgi:anti-anti-sigma factor|nr:STAS domain-containing protein [Candidatus Adiutrix sp.]
MKWEIETRDGQGLLKVSGRLDATTTTEFSQAAAQALAGTPARLLVDLSGLEFISSAGLRGVLLLAKSCQKDGRPLGFCGLRPLVEDVFKISGFMSILKIFPDQAAAADGW